MEFNNPRKALASFVVLALMIMMGFVSQSWAYDFYVGGKDGWVPNPSYPYNNWAEKNRFRVNDKLVFHYKKGEDSVLLVNKQDYDSCNTTKPIKKLDDGHSIFNLDRSGHFFFISGDNNRCQNGEKLIVAVMAMKHSKGIPPALPLPLPPSLSPSGLPSGISQAPSVSDVYTPAPAPVAGDNFGSGACGVEVGSVWVWVWVLSVVFVGVHFG